MVTDAQIFDLIYPHSVTIKSWYDDGLTLMHVVADSMAEHGCRMYKRHKAMFLNNYVLEKASKYFETVTGIDVIRDYETLVLIFENGVTGRFRKQAIVHSKPCKSTTRNLQYIQGVLFNEYPNAVAIEITYDTNKVWSVIEKLTIFKRVDKTPIPVFKIGEISDEKPQTFKAMEAIITNEEEEKQLRIKDK